MCQQGYMGVDCSVSKNLLKKEIESKEFRVGMGMFIVFLLAAAIAGILFMLSFWWCYKLCSGTADMSDASKDVDIMEQWETKGSPTEK
jgi:hypothetical protein